MTRAGMFGPRVAAGGRVFAAVLCVALLPRCRRNPPDEGTVAREIDVGGRTRGFLVHPPRGEFQGKLPCVIALHGAKGDAASQESLTSLSVLGDREGFVSVYPEGVDKSWNDGRPTTDAAKAGVDDVRFITELIAWLAANERVDNTRIYLTGMSNGAMMTHRLACELSGLVAAAAPVAGLMPEGLTCAPSRPVPITMFYNTNDSLMPFGGGELELGAGGRVLSAGATRDAWAKHNGCGPPPAEVALPDQDPDDGTSVRRADSPACKADVVLYVIENGGHTWPGGLQYLGPALIGKTTRDISASEIMWQFFRDKRGGPQ